MTGIDQKKSNFTIQFESILTNLETERAQLLRHLTEKELEIAYCEQVLEASLRHDKYPHSTTISRELGSRAMRLLRMMEKYDD